MCRFLGRSITVLLTFSILSCSVGFENANLALEPIGIIKSKESKEIISSPFGIQAGTTEDSILQFAAQIGVKWTRLGAHWSDIENRKGVYRWNNLDTAINAVISYGITPFITIGGGNELYSELGTYADDKLAAIYGYKPEPPVKDVEAFNAFLTFVEATVTRYKDKIDYWEIWNEPNHRNYWGATPDGKEYGILLLKTATLVRQLDPGCKIIAGATAGIDPVFTNDFLKVCPDSLIDIISFHNYGAIPEERVYLAVELWEVINRYNKNIELWQGECGYPSHSSTRDYRGRAPWGLNIQAKWLLRQSFVDLYFCHTSLSNYFKLAHIGGKGEKHERTNLSPLDSIFGYPERGGSRVRTKGINEKCLLSNPDFIKKPGFFAYQNLCAIWKPDYKTYKINYAFEITDEGDFYGISEDDAFPSVPLLASFADSSGNHLVAYWLPWNMQENLINTAKISITLHNLSFKSPVCIDPMSGKVYPVNMIKKDNHCIISMAPLTDFPLIIAEQSTIKLK